MSASWMTQPNGGTAFGASISLKTFDKLIKFRFNGANERIEIGFALKEFKWCKLLKSYIFLRTLRTYLKTR